jgi:multicomponent Na+:H+ antiporter subunit D
MGMVFALLAGFCGCWPASYADRLHARRQRAKQPDPLLRLLRLCLSTAFGVAFAGDLFTFFIFYELLTISTYPLVTHKGNAEAVAAGRKYLGYLLSAGGVLVLLGDGHRLRRHRRADLRAGGFVGDALGPG